MADSAPASWRDRLQPGSFRGVPFVTESHDHALGRRLSTHEYPLRDVPYTEDIGRKAREYTLELFVIGDDYMAARDRLREALEYGGPGELVHPYLGTQSVQVREGRLRETMREGRMARFSVTFVEAGLEIAPDTKKDTAWAVEQRSDQLSQAAEDSFADTFDITGPSRLLTQAKAGLDRVLGGVKDAVGAPLSQLKLSKDIASSLWGTPGGLAQWLMSQLGLLGGLTSASSSAVALGLTRQTIPTAASTSVATAGTSAQPQSQANLQAIDSLVRQSAIAQAAKAAAATSHSTAEDALTVRDALCDAIDTECGTAPDVVYARLVDLRVAVVEDLGIRAAQLPRLTAYQLPRTLPAVVVAHQVYGDATREGDIVSRNKVRHPGALPGGTVLEVLSDAGV